MWFPTSNWEFFKMLTAMTVAKVTGRFPEGEKMTMDAEPQAAFRAWLNSRMLTTPVCNALDLPTEHALWAAFLAGWRATARRDVVGPIRC